MIAILIPLPIPANPRRRPEEITVEEEGGLPAAVAGRGEGRGRHHRPRRIRIRIPRPRLNGDGNVGGSSGGEVARHHLLLPPHRVRRVGAEAANGHPGERDDRAILRDPAHHHLMTMVQLPLGGEGRERRRPRGEERRTRSFRLARPQRRTMNKAPWWQHLWR